MKYKHFGIMMDCSGNAVMKVEKVKQLIDAMQKMGYDLLELCTDDTYKIENEPYFGYLRGGYTAEEIKEIDDYARAHGVELVPCIQTLGHFTNLVKIPHYNNIVDIDNILLVEEPATYDLIDKMLASVSKMYSSRLVNLGMDEAHLLGLGKYLDKHGYHNRLEIFLRHLNKVVEIAQKYGLKPHLWSDMFFKFVTNGSYYADDIHIPTDIINSIPEEVGVVYWDYGEHEIKKEIFDSMCAAHKEMNREIWFAGGAWTWNGFAPHNGWSLYSMKPAMESVIKYGIENVMITVWAGNGAECSYFSVLPSLYAIRQFANGNFDETEIEKGFNRLFDVSYRDMMLLDIPNRSKLNPNADKVSSASKTLLYNDCFLGWKDSAIEVEWPIPYGEYAKQLAAAKERAGEFRYIFATLEKLCYALELKGDLGIRTRAAYRNRDLQALKDLIDIYTETEARIKEFHSALKKSWMEDNKPFGWEVQEARLGGLRSRILDCRERIEDFLEGKITAIPELEEKILPYADWKLQYNCYRRLITVNEL